MDRSLRGRAVKGREAGAGTQVTDFLRRHLNWILGGALGLLLLQDIFGTHGLIAMRRSQQETWQVQHEINELDEENRQLQDRVKALKSDPEAIERIAREEMGLAKPGEYIFKTTPKSGSETSSSSAPSASPESSAPSAAAASPSAPAGPASNPTKKR